MLSKVEESGPDELNNSQKIVTRVIPMLYVRGDLVVAVSPLKKK